MQTTDNKSFDSTRRSRIFATAAGLLASAMGGIYFVRDNGTGFDRQGADKPFGVFHRLGVKSYIVKPVNFERLAEAVQDLGMYWLLLNQSPRIEK